MRAVPRRVLLQGPGEAADVSVGQGPQGRPDPRLLRGERVQGLDARRDAARRCSRRSTRSSRCGTRASTRGRASRAPTATCRTSAAGAMKISDHHVRSPLLNINRACQTCHDGPRSELRERVSTIQDRTSSVRNVAMDALVALDRRHQGRRRRAGGARTSSWQRPAHEQRRGAVPARLHRGRELDGLPRRAGGRARARALDRRDPAGPDWLREATGIKTGANTAPPFAIGLAVPPSVRERQQPSRRSNSAEQTPLIRGAGLRPCSAPPPMNSYRRLLLTIGSLVLSASAVCAQPAPAATVSAGRSCRRCRPSAGTASPRATRR